MSTGNLQNRSVEIYFSDGLGAIWFATAGAVYRTRNFRKEFVCVEAMSYQVRADAE